MKFISKSFVSPPPLRVSENTGFAFFVLDALIIAYYAAAFYPGYLTSDSIYMLQQTTGVDPLSNWHPTFITLLWGWLFGLYKSAGGIWLIQITMLVFSAHFLAKQIRNPIIALACYSLLLLLPPIFTNMAALWKDDWAVIFSVLCTGYTLRAISGKSRIDIIMTIAFFLLGGLTRVDYFIVLFPLVFGAIAFGLDYHRFTRLTLKRTLLIAFFSIFVAIFVLSKILGSQVEQKRNPWVTFAIWDIAGVESNGTNGNKLPGYNCMTSDPLVFGGSRLYEVNLPQGDNPLAMSVDSESKFVARSWISAIAKHPGAYLRHRGCVAEVFLGLGPDVHYPYPGPIYPDNAYVGKAERSALNLDLYWYFDSHASGLAYRYWIYLLVSMMALIAAFVTRTIDVRQCVLAVSIFMSAARVMILPAADFRYGLWMTVGTIILCSLFLDGLLYRCLARDRS